MPVALTLFVVVAAFGWVLVVFFRNGHAWARWVLAALVLFAGFASVQGLDRDLPTTFVVLTVVTMLVERRAAGVPLPQGHQRLPAGIGGRVPLNG